MSDILRGSLTYRDSKPLVSIVMAVYNPRMDWLKEQLQSLNQQTYKNMKVLVRDDCSNEVEFEEIERAIVKEIINFPVSIYSNATNVGSNKTFEMLTQQAEGEYIAYCDQDDVWLPEKIEKLVEFIEKTKSQLVCSDVYVIDENGITIADSISTVRKRHIFKRGEGLASELLFRNFVIGCTMLMPIKLAKAARPFIEEMVHDHYLALYATTKGSIEIYPQNLTKYRIHGSNQTNVLSGVKSKKDYYAVRIQPYAKRMEEIKNRFKISEAEQAYKWAEARRKYYTQKKSGVELWKLRHCDKKTTLFELVFLNMPENVFLKAIEYIRRGKII